MLRASPHKEEVMAENKRGQSNPGSQSGQQKQQRGNNPNDQTKNRKQPDQDFEESDER